MEIQVVVDSEQMFRKGIKKQRAVEAFFTFVSLDSKGKTLLVTPLKVGVILFTYNISIT